MRENVVLLNDLLDKDTAFYSIIRMDGMTKFNNNSDQVKVRFGLNCRTELALLQGLLAGLKLLM